MLYFNTPNSSNDDSTSPVNSPDVRHRHTDITHGRQTFDYIQTSVVYDMAIYWWESTSESEETGVVYMFLTVHCIVNWQYVTLPNPNFITITKSEPKVKYVTLPCTNWLQCQLHMSRRAINVSQSMETLHHHCCIHTNPFPSRKWISHGTCLRA